MSKTQIDKDKAIEVLADILIRLAEKENKIDREVGVRILGEFVIKLDE